MLGWQMNKDWCCRACWEENVHRICRFDITVVHPKPILLFHYVFLLESTYWATALGDRGGSRFGPPWLASDQKMHKYCVRSINDAKLIGTVAWDPWPFVSDFFLDKPAHCSQARIALLSIVSQSLKLIQIVSVMTSIPVYETHWGKSKSCSTKKVESWGTEQ